MTDGTRCAVCGKLVEEGNQIVHVSVGKMGKQDPEKVWGIIHRTCFNRALPSPKAALDEIRRLAKSQAA